MFRKFLCYLYSRHRVCFCKAHVADICRFQNSDRRIVCRKYREKDAGNLQLLLNNLEFAPDFSLNNVPDRIRKGHLFYIALLDGKIIGYCWWSFGNVYLPYCNTILKLSEEESFCYNNYVHIDHRGTGILNSIRSRAYIDLAKKGIVCDWLCYYSWNYPAQRSAQKFCYHHVSSIFHGYFCGLKYVFATDTSKKLTPIYTPFELWIILFRLRL